MYKRQVLYERLLMHKLTVQRESGLWTYYFDAQKDLPAWADGDALVLEISGCLLYTSRCV